MYYEEPKKGTKTLIFLSAGVVVLGLIIFAIIMLIIGNKKKPAPPKEANFGCELEVINGELSRDNTYSGLVEISFKSKSPENVASYGIGTSKTYNKKEIYRLEVPGETIIYGYIKDINGNETQCNIKVTIKEPSNLYCVLGIKNGTEGLNGWYTSGVEVEFKAKGVEEDKISKIGIIGHKNQSNLDVDENEDLDRIEVPYNEQETLLIEEDGTTEVYGRIEDNNGNVATCKLVIKKAAELPKCTLKVVEGKKEGNSYVGDVKVEIEKLEFTAAEITGQGVGITKNYEQESYIVNKDGTTNVYGYLRDEAGNESTCDISIVRGTTPDPKPDPDPVPTCSLKINSGTKGANNWYVSNVVVGFATGSNNPAFGIGTSKNYNGNATLSVSKDGINKVYGYVKNSNGKEGSCATTINKDTTKPICSLKVTSGTLVNGSYNTQVIVGFNQNPTDAISGVDTYGIGTTKAYKKNNTFTVASSGTHTITGYVKDNAGNEGTCSINIKISINLLANMAKVGDYVEYDAGSFTETKAFPTNTASYNFSFGGYNAGNSLNTRTVNCQSKTSTAITGWRILSISGTTVTLIHGGAPECYYHPSITGQGNIGYNSEKLLSGSTLGIPNGLYTSTPRNWSSYINASYATGATIFTKKMLDTYLSLSGTSMNDNIIKIGAEYYLGTASSSSALYGVSAAGKLNGYSYKVFGIRPVVTLKSTIKTDGKNANGAWTIKN